MPTVAGFSPEAVFATAGEVGIGSGVADGSMVGVALGFAVGLGSGDSVITAGMVACASGAPAATLEFAISA